MHVVSCDLAQSYLKLFFCSPSSRLEGFVAQGVAVSCDWIQTCRLQDSLPGVQLILQTLPPQEEADQLHMIERDAQGLKQAKRARGSCSHHAIVGAP